MNNIEVRLTRVREIVAAAAVDAGRNPREIKLIAVSKMQPVESVEAAVRAGQSCFGESTTQEALAKIPHFPNRGLEWHFIGHLQTNKVKFIPGNFSWLHSLDSLKLAQRLSQAAQERELSINALMEINITGDARKHGLAPAELSPMLERLLELNLPGTELRGLMAIGPHPATESESRAAFAALRRLRDQMRESLALPRFSELSMGMSGDFAAAIAEGSTMLRMGTAVFGDRHRAP